MRYAVELFFDKEMEGELYRIIHKIADAGLSTKFLEWKTRPHIALGCFHDANEEKCKRVLDDFARKHRNMRAYLDSVGMFVDTKVVFANPHMSQSMYDMHRELHGMLSWCDTAGEEWYLPDCWAPHCTLAMTAGDGEEVFFKVSDLVLHEFHKLAGYYAEIGLVRIGASTVEEVCTISLLDK